MGVEVEVCIRIALDHLPEVLDTLQGIHNAQRIGQHKPPDTDVAEGVHHLIDIERRFLHAVRPVLEVEVHGHLLLPGVLHRRDNVLDMFFGCLLQLLLTMAQRAFRQEVHGLTATRIYPVDALPAVDESQHLHPAEHIHLRSIAANHTDGFLLTFRHLC